MGHKTDREDVRMHAVVGYPYLIFYRVYPKHHEVRIVSILHGARRHPGFQEDSAAFAA